MKDFTTEDLEKVVDMLERRLETHIMTPERRQETEQSLMDVLNELERRRRWRLYSLIGLMALGWLLVIGPLLIWAL